MSNTTINPYNNNNLDYGVIYSETVDGHKIDCKIEMTDSNIEIDHNGMLTLISMTPNNKLPANVHYSVNDNFSDYSDKLIIQTWINGHYFADIKWSEFDAENLLSDYLL